MDDGRAAKNSNYKNSGVPVGLLSCEGSLIVTHSGSGLLHGLVRRKTVIGINIATSANRSIAKNRKLAVAPGCGIKAVSYGLRFFLLRFSL